MSDLVLVVDLLKAHLTTVDEVYTGSIPEGQLEPAILLTNVANPYSRELEGRKVKVSSVWRITVVARTPSAVELVLDELEDLDDTSTMVFQQIWTNLVNTEYGMIDQPYRRAFYDLMLFKR